MAVHFIAKLKLYLRGKLILYELKLFVIFLRWRMTSTAAPITTNAATTSTRAHCSCTSFPVRPALCTTSAFGPAETSVHVSAIGL